VFRFSAHPATITVTAGIQDAFSYLGLTWKKWLPVVAIVAGASVLMYAAAGRVSTGDLYVTDPETGRLVVNQSAFGRYIGATLVVGLGLGLLSLIAGWAFNAVAISGLRNRPVTVYAVLGRGLLALAAQIILAVAFIVTFIVAVFVIAILAAVAAPLAGLLVLAAIFGGVPAFLYVTIRLTFVSLAIFDGFGPIEAFGESWRLSQGSVLRLFGWGLMAIVIGIAFLILSGVVAAPFTAAGADPLGSGLSAAVTSTYACFTIFFMAVLYESQRARMDPNLYGPVPMPFYGGWGYPAPPPVIPGWTDPNQPSAAYGYPPRSPNVNVWEPGPPPPGYGYPQQPPAGPPPGYGQPTGWVVPNQPLDFRYPSAPPQPGYRYQPQAGGPPPQPWGPPPSGATPPAQPAPPAPAEPPTGQAPAEPPAPTEPPAS
jgi:hypothetical protein